MLLSLHREFGNQSTIGVVATTNDFGSSSNRVFSVDRWLRLSPTWFFTGQAVRSYDRQPGGVQTQGRLITPICCAPGGTSTMKQLTPTTAPVSKRRLGSFNASIIRKLNQYAAYFWRPEGGK